MPDRKDSIGEKRIEQELIEQERPLYIFALTAFLKVFFFFYDALVFIPFKIFADPEKKKERSASKKVAKILNISKVLLPKIGPTRR
jgi:hypothetical protein